MRTLAPIYLGYTTATLLDVWETALRENSDAYHEACTFEVQIRSYSDRLSRPFYFNLVGEEEE